MDEREKFEDWLEKQPYTWRDQIRPSDAMRIWQAALASRDVEPCGFDRNGSHSENEYVCTCGCHCGDCSDNTPPLTKAAVAAAIEQCAKVCEPRRWKLEYKAACIALLCELRALQTDDGLAALREFGMDILHEGRANANRGFDMSDEQLLMAIVDRVLREMGGE